MLNLKKKKRKKSNILVHLYFYIFMLFFEIQKILKTNSFKEMNRMQIISYRQTCLESPFKKTQGSRE
jgi:hypothetical protein